MLTRDEASEIVRASLGSLSEVEAVVLEDETLEYDFGWVFFYNSEAFVKGGSWRDTLAGNAPVIVDRSTGQLYVTGTAQPLEVYVEAYKKYGDPHARPGKAVRLSGWKTGASAVSAIKAIRSHSRVSLIEAKRWVEQVLEGGTVGFEAESVDAAATAVTELHACGFSAEQLSDGRAA